MAQYIDKSALVAEIENLLDKGKYHEEYDCAYRDGNNGALYALKGKLDTLEVKDHYEQYIQYSSIEAGIKAHAEDYSFNIESELFNQLTKEQQKLWRKEIEQAAISGGYNGLGLAKDPRYKENLEVKEVDLERELNNWRRNHFRGKVDINGLSGEYLERTSQLDIAKHFFELGMAVSNPVTAADRGMTEEIIINLKRVEQDYRIDLTKEIKWLRNKTQKGEEV